jgi:HD-GYP domain-containing protein (c-di-GMP phosphodiesterase class II)
MQHSKYMDEVGKIMDLIDQKGHYTKDHSNRTRNLCGRLGITLGIERTTRRHATKIDS